MSPQVIVDSCPPGRWYAVLGDRVTLLLPGAERARVAGLWELVDDGADFDEVLDGLLSDGIRTLTGFVLVGHGESTRVLVRGEASVTLSAADGVTTVSGCRRGHVGRPHPRRRHRWHRRPRGGRPGVDLALTSGVARVGSLGFGDAPSSNGRASRRPARDRDEVADTGPDTEDDAVRTPRGRAGPPPRPAEPVADVVPIEAAATTSEPDPREPDPREHLTFGAPTDDDPTPTGEQPPVVDDRRRTT